MWQNILDSLGAFVVNVKAAVVVAATTIAAGLGGLMDLLPDTMTGPGSIIGGCLSLVLLYFHVRKGRLEVQNLVLKNRMLRRQEQADYDRSIGQESIHNE